MTRTPAAPLTPHPKPGPIRSAACALLLSAVAIAQPGAPDESAWFNADTLPLLGAGFDDAPRYTRLPERLEPEVRPPVWSLSRNASGIVLRFASDAPSIHARWRTGTRSMPHMTDNAIKGLDLYALTDTDARYLGTARAAAGPDHTAALVTGLSAERREYALYLPLYERLESLELRVPEGSAIEPPEAPWFASPPIVVYGTSITQGACASRPGTAFPAQLGRLLRREVINLGFSGNGTLDEGMIRALTEIDAAAYVLDCLPNLNPDQVEPRTLRSVRTLLDTRPETPVLLVENITYPGTRDRPGLRDRLAAKNAALRSAHATLASEHPRADLRILTALPPGETTDDETADGVHPTDAGMRRHAERLAVILRDMLAD
jgi:lysophospholipase L1-like esterase